MSNLDDINKKRSIMHIRDSISEILNGYIFKKLSNVDYDETKNIITEFLNRQVKNEIINSSFMVKVRKQKWRNFYPSKIKFILALFYYYICHKIFKAKLESDNLRWYHLIFPFEVKYPVSTMNKKEFVEDFLIELEREKIVNNSDIVSDDWFIFESELFANPRIEFKTPHNTIFSEIKLSPVRSCEKIDITFKID